MEKAHMNRRASAIISAYTGFLAGPFEALHEYVTEKFGRPVFTHEMGGEAFWKELQELSKEDFIALAGSVPTE